MSLNSTPRGQRVHIGFFGVRNAGKSSLVNAVVGQDIAVVSSVEGTTTDAVVKAMELLPVGPVSIIDTPGIDDVGALGEKRVERTKRVLRRCDVAVLVVPAGRDLVGQERDLLECFKERSVPFVVALSKIDAVASSAWAFPEGLEGAGAQMCVSAATGQGVNEFKEALAQVARPVAPKKQLVADMLEPGSTVVLVIPLDGSAPLGRIILPQQMVLRDVLDAQSCALSCQPEQLPALLANLSKAPDLVVTDSQAFAEVARMVDENVPLTSFSILMARYKGELASLAQGAAALARLSGESRVLISEGCTHHRQCDDIGTVKIPAWIRAYTGAQPQFSFTSGGEFPDNLDAFDLVVHCGGCMLNEREMHHRMTAAQRAGVPVVNYGIAIACMHGLLERALAPFSVSRS